MKGKRLFSIDSIMLGEENDEIEFKLENELATAAEAERISQKRAKEKEESKQLSNEISEFVRRINCIISDVTHGKPLDAELASIKVTASEKLFIDMIEANFSMSSIDESESLSVTSEASDDEQFKKDYFLAGGESPLESPAKRRKKKKKRKLGKRAQSMTKFSDSHEMSPLRSQRSEKVPRGSDAKRTVPSSHSTSGVMQHLSKKIEEVDSVWFDKFKEIEREKSLLAKAKFGEQPNARSEFRSNSIAEKAGKNRAEKFKSNVESKLSSRRTEEMPRQDSNPRFRAGSLNSVTRMKSRKLEEEIEDELKDEQRSQGQRVSWLPDVLDSVKEEERRRSNELLRQYYKESALPTDNIQNEILSRISIRKQSILRYFQGNGDRPSMFGATEQQNVNYLNRGARGPRKEEEGSQTARERMLHSTGRRGPRGLIRQERPSAKDLEPFRDVFANPLTQRSSFLNIPFADPRAVHQHSTRAHVSGVPSAFLEDDEPLEIRGRGKSQVPYSRKKGRNFNRYWKNYVDPETWNSFAGRRRGRSKGRTERISPPLRRTKSAELRRKRSTASVVQSAKHPRSRAYSHSSLYLSKRWMDQRGSTRSFIRFFDEDRRKQRRKERRTNEAFFSQGRLVWQRTTDFAGVPPFFSRKAFALYIDWLRRAKLRRNVDRILMEYLRPTISVIEREAKPDQRKSILRAFVAVFKDLRFQLVGIFPPTTIDVLGRATLTDLLAANVVEEVKKRIMALQQTPKESNNIDPLRQQRAGSTTPERRRLPPPKSHKRSGSVATLRLHDEHPKHSNNRSPLRMGRAQIGPSQAELNFRYYRGLLGQPDQPTLVDIHNRQLLAEVTPLLVREMADRIEIKVLNKKESDLCWIAYLMLLVPLPGSSDPRISEEKRRTQPSWKHLVKSTLGLHPGDDYFRAVLQHHRHKRLRKFEDKELSLIVELKKVMSWLPFLDGKKQFYHNFLSDESCERLTFDLKAVQARYLAIL